MHVLRQPLRRSLLFLASTGSTVFLQLCVFLSVPLLRLYNGARSKNAALSRVMKPLFYLYYPLHLFLIGLIRTFFLS